MIPVRKIRRMHMRGLIAAIASAIAAAFRTVVEWCWKTGRYVTRQIVTCGGLLGGATPPVVEPDPVVPLTDHRLPDVERTKKIKRLAAAMDEPDVDAGLFLGVSDPVVQWLSAMNRDMRTLVAGAGAVELEDHMKGRRAIRGLLAYDRASVEEWKKAGGAEGGGGRGRKPPLRAAVVTGFGKMNA
jgi:hypothetical protein